METDGSENLPEQYRVILDASVVGDEVRLALLQNRPPVIGAYVLCSLDDGGPNQIPELQLDIPVAEQGTLPDTFSFTKPQQVFSFRIVTTECMDSARLLHTVQPGYVTEDVARVLETGWPVITEL